jgi:hypothetical protein
MNEIIELIIYGITIIFGIAGIILGFFVIAYAFSMIFRDIKRGRF